MCTNFHFCVQIIYVISKKVSSNLCKYMSVSSKDRCSAIKISKCDFAVLLLYSQICESYFSLVKGNYFPYSLACFPSPKQWDWIKGKTFLGKKNDWEKNLTEMTEIDWEDKKQRNSIEDPLKDTLMWSIKIFLKNSMMISFSIRN